MNYWKTVWDAYYKQANRRAYLLELTRLASWPTRLCFLIGVAIFVFGIKDALNGPRNEWPWLMILGEFSVLGIIEHVRTERFAASYGSTDKALGPAEREEQRGHRYLLFKRALEAANVSRSHVRDLFEIVEAKDDLETQHNTALNKFAIFVSGFLVSAAIAFIRGLEAGQAALLMLWISIASLALAPMFWLMPTRRSRLKELKYFMVLYCKS